MQAFIVGTYMRSESVLPLEDSLNSAWKYVTYIYMAWENFDLSVSVYGLLHDTPPHYHADSFRKPSVDCYVWSVELAMRMC
uniref:Uncharacterized protein n=1 Tax=Amphimedon queenslandica TaxID=400682 RepID=A0A1X7T9E1_AMPQE